MQKPVLIKITIAALILAFITGCAQHFTPETFSDPYGFFSGIWHGMIFPFALLANVISWLLSLIDISFLTDIEIIGRPNTGLWYYLGFFIGLISLGSGAK